MSISVMSLVWERSDHKGSDLLTLLAISDNAKDEGVAYPGFDYLAGKTRLSVRASQYAVGRLLDGDELTLVSRGGGATSNVYQIELDVLRAKEPKVRPRKSFTPAGFAPVQDPTLNTQDSTLNTQPTAPEPLEPLGTDSGGTRERADVENVLAILASSPRLAVDDVSTRVQVENAIASCSADGAQAAKAAHEAVVLAGDPDWRMDDPGRLFLLTLRKVCEPADARPSAGRRLSKGDRVDADVERLLQEAAELERLERRGAA